MNTAGRAVAVAAALSVSVPLAASEAGRAADANREVHFDLHAFRVIKSDSGPVNYYTFVDQAPLPYIHAAYRPPYETTVLGYPIPEN
jgi:hypothetical protein